MLSNYDHSDESANHLMLASSIFFQLQRICENNGMYFTPQYRSAHAFLSAEKLLPLFIESHRDLFVRVGANITDEDISALADGNINKFFFSPEYVLQIHFYWSAGKPIKKLFSKDVNTWNFTLSIAISYAKKTASDCDCCDLLLVEEEHTLHHKMFDKFISFFKEFDVSKLEKHPEISIWPANASENSRKLLALKAKR